MQNNKNKNDISFYAAANGFTGFKSYFDEIFNYKMLEKLYIIKGGPGTGKSTFMKNIAKIYEDKGLTVDRIFCSSDPKSLDGIIVDKKVALIDGTAPHEANTKLPGAFDEIINLGENWNSNELKTRKAEIIEISRNKSKNYSSAYKYLSFCKVLSDYIVDETSKYFNTYRADNLIDKITESFKIEESPRRQTRLFSSFSKYGYLSILPHENMKICSLFPDDFRAFCFLKYLVSKSKKFSFTEIKSPFDPLLTEGIIYESENIYFGLSEKSEDTISITDLFYIPKEKEEELKSLTDIIKVHLSTAKKYFSSASDEHFKLEEIYKNAMDFDKNHPVLEKTLKNIDKILLL